MAVIQEYALGSAVTLMSTELNSLASSVGLTAGAISSVGGTSGLFNNTAGGGSLGGYAFGRFELLLLSPAGTLTANTAANIWLLGTVDGTLYEDGSASIIPPRRPDLIMPVRAISSGQRNQVIAPIPPGNWYCLLSHNTGQTWASSGNVLRVQPVTWQGV